MNLRQRSEEYEIMDDFQLQGKPLESALDKIASINQMLGGNRLTLNAVKKIIQKTDRSKITIVDFGCGNGDILRRIESAQHSKEKHLYLKGVDANPHAITYAKKLSDNYPNINFECADILNQNYVPETCDIILLTLTLHHFSDTDILVLLQKACRSARVAVIINDLQRSGLAYYLFSGLSFLAGFDKINDNDGKLSILRGFQKKDILKFAEQIKAKKHDIRWKWAFRYQWIISTS